MVFDPMSRIQQNRHEITTYRSLSQQYFNLDEDEFMIAPHYSKEPKFIIIRSIALPYIKKFTRDQPDMMVGYLALNFFDHFLSRNGDIPVVLHGFGFERNLELFVFCCVSIAFKSRFGNYLFTEFWKTRGRMEKEDSVMIMEREIMKGLNKEVRRRAVTPMLLSYILQHKLEKEYPEQVFPNGPRILVSRLLIEIQKDIRFTEFGLSTLAAAAILVTSYRVQPDMYSKFKHSIYSFGCVEKMEVKACLDELKTHYIVDYMLNPKRQAEEEWKEMSGMGVGKMKGKMDGNELLSDRYSLMERVLICLWPICNCFGIHFGSFRNE